MAYSHSPRHVEKIISERFNLRLRCPDHTPPAPLAFANQLKHKHASPFHPHTDRPATSRIHSNGALPRSRPPRAATSTLRTHQHAVSLILGLASLPCTGMASGACWRTRSRRCCAYKPQQPTEAPGRRRGEVMCLIANLIGSQTFRNNYEAGIYLNQRKFPLIAGSSKRRRA